MTSSSDLCRECELSQKVRELEEDNWALNEALMGASTRLHQLSPWNVCHFRACLESPLKGYAKEGAE